MKKTTSDRCKAVLHSGLGSKWAEIKAKHRELDIPAKPKYRQLPIAKKGERL